MPAIDELAESEKDVEIVWRAFELRPEPEPLPDATSEFFTTMWENSIYPLAENLGVKIKMPTLKPRSRIAHEAAKWAQSQGKFDQFRDGLFRAYFEKGEDIEQKESAVSLARDLGLDAESLSDSLKQEEFLAMVLADENAAAGLGLNGVPAFIANRQSGMMGIQSLENLKSLVASIR
ncbi:MAG: thioredoxin domain-containing protein [Pyrinomonadaceae bacterium]|nr:thioredoxin domain-containing protein [Pyrinomonadaceae bacterium]